VDVPVRPCAAVMDGVSRNASPAMPAETFGLTHAFTRTGNWLSDCATTSGVMVILAAVAGAKHSDAKASARINDLMSDTSHCIMRRQTLLRPYKIGRASAPAARCVIPKH